MSDPIKNGDLVMVVLPCPYCGEESGLGHTFMVAWIGRASGTTNCCEREVPLQPCADESSNPMFEGGWQVSRLRLLKPPYEAECDHREEEINA